MSNRKPPEKILFVDDEVQILDSFRRQLRGRFNIATAAGPVEAEAALMEQGPFAVVVSDMRMPYMDGAELLSVVRRRWPDTVRIILTGYAEMESAARAINEGNVFRFLTKPCEPDELTRTLVDAIRQYRLITAERELLAQTLAGSVAVLTDMLAMVKPMAFGRSSRAARYARAVAEIMGLENIWEVETAAMLSQIGCLELPDDLLLKAYNGAPMSLREKEAFAAHPDTASEILARIPRLEMVRKIIENQNRPLSAGRADPVHDGVPLGARILKAALDMDSLEGSGRSKADAIERLRRLTEVYDSGIVGALERILGDEAKFKPRALSVQELETGMILDQDVVRGNTMILSKGQQLSRTLVLSLRSSHRVNPLPEPIKVLVPRAQAPV